jgi:hypothetical protein
MEGMNQGLGEWMGECVREEERFEVAWEGRFVGDGKKRKTTA